MFHVEQKRQQDTVGWEYQVRWPESRVPGLRDWGKVMLARDRVVMVPLADPTVAVEARWRIEVEGRRSEVEGRKKKTEALGRNAAVPVEEGGRDGTSQPHEEGWEAAVPREWGEVRCRFLVMLRKAVDFSGDPVVHAGAMVRGFPAVFEIVMPRQLLWEGPVEVEGVAIQAGAGHMLITEAGDFVSEDEAMAISSLAGSQVTLLEVERAMPEARPFKGLFGVKAGRLSDDEVGVMKKWLEGKKEEQERDAPATACGGTPQPQVEDREEGGRDVPQTAWDGTSQPQLGKDGDRISPLLEEEEVTGA